MKTIADLASDLRSGRVTAVALAKSTFRLIEDAQPRFNAFAALTYDRAMREAESADQRLQADTNAPLLCGIPYAVKDIFDVDGEITRGGCPILQDNRATSDCIAVRRLTRDGMVLVGKTRTSPLACDITGMNHSEDPPRNPWKALPHIAGGSSSGSAVAVAAGLVPVALGSDTSGSVRVPAALTGIVGHKTTLGEIGRSGMLPLSESCDTVGTLCRSVTDAEMVFDSMCGLDPRDRNTLNSVGPARVKPIEDCRIVLVEGEMLDWASPEIAASVLALARQLEALGASVETRSITEFSEVASLSECEDLGAAEAWRNNWDILKAWGRERDWLMDWMLRGQSISDARLAECRTVQSRMQRDFAETYRDFDAFIAPTARAASRPFSVMEENFADLENDYVANTMVGSFLNLCGLAVPTGLDRDGLPMGAMLMGHQFADKQILGLGKMLEAAGATTVIAP